MSRNNLACKAGKTIWPVCLAIYLVIIFAGSAHAGRKMDFSEREEEEDAPRAEELTSSELTDAAAGPTSGFDFTDLPMLPGPRRIIAVGKFDAVGSFTEKFGDWDVGGGLSAMMTTALAESERFQVVERANISQLLSEQEMAASGVTAQDSGPQAGNVSGAQLMLYGSVTEFGFDKGKGFSFGFSDASSLFSAAASRQKQTGKIALDVRLVDASTTRILDTITVKEELDNKSVDFSVGHSGLEVGGNRFWRTPLGEATRRALSRVVREIVEVAAEVEWVGRVVEMDGDDMYINGGTNAGIEAGDQFLVERILKTMTDPASGQVLGHRKLELGVVEVELVQEAFSIGKYIKEADLPPKRGDLLRLQ